jgi:GT2 family glycosyltransferase
MIGIVILNYKTWEMTIKCVDSIEQTFSGLCHIFIIDNHSPNESFEKLLRHFESCENVAVIDSMSNCGYAKGNNIGIRKAIEYGCDKILISNNDIIFTPHAIESLDDFIDSTDNVDFVAPMVLNHDDKIIALPTIKQMSIAKYIKHQTILNRIMLAPDKNKYIMSRNQIGNEPIEIYKFSGCCFMARSISFQKIDLFDENTFLYYEEDILAFRSKIEGLKSFYLPDSKVYHYHGYTTGTNTYFVNTELFKSEMYFLKNYYMANGLSLFIIYLLRMLVPINKKRVRLNSLKSIHDYFVFIRTTFRILISKS